MIKTECSFEPTKSQCENLIHEKPKFFLLSNNNVETNN